jgi:putative FmdB family regulatory protein
MPTYEYICRACGHEFEEFQSIKADPIAVCPECRKKKVERKISTGGAVIFKGGGFYETDYRSDSYREGEKRAQSGSGDAEKATAAPAESTPSGAAQATPAKTPSGADTAGASRGSASDSKGDAAPRAEKSGASPSSGADSAARAENSRIESRATHPSRIGRGIGNSVRKDAASGSAAAGKNPPKPATSAKAAAKASAPKKPARRAK